MLVLGSRRRLPEGSHHILYDRADLFSGQLRAEFGHVDATVVSLVAAGSLLGRKWWAK